MFVKNLSIAYKILLGNAPSHQPNTTLKSVRTERIYTYENNM